MDKKYGIEYEREVLAAFDRMAKRYEDQGKAAADDKTKAVPAASDGKAVTDKTIVFRKLSEDRTADTDHVDKAEEMRVLEVSAVGAAAAAAEAPVSSDTENTKTPDASEDASMEHVIEDAAELFAADGIEPLKTEGSKPEESSNEAPVHEERALAEDHDEIAKTAGYAAASLAIFRKLNEDKAKNKETASEEKAAETVVVMPSEKPEKTEPASDASAKNISVYEAADPAENKEAAGDDKSLSEEKPENIAEKAASGFAGLALLKKLKGEKSEKNAEKPEDSGENAGTTESKPEDNASKPDHIAEKAASGFAGLALLKKLKGEKFEEKAAKADDQTGKEPDKNEAAAAAAADAGKKHKKKELTEEELAEKEKRNAAIRKKRKKRRHRRRTLLLFLFLLIILAFLAACGYVGMKVMDIIKDTPEINPDNIYELLGENSVLVDGNGQFLENIYSGGSLRTNIEFSELPDNLINAFVCIEDKTFWEHHGFNFVRIVGAVVEKVTGQSDRIGGTSTITQQLARNLYLADVKDVRDMDRKIREAYYTVVLESALTKEQILEAYLNTIYLGYNSDGIAAAAEAYFSKDVQDLSLLECATLAALPQSPNNYAPIKRVATSAVSDPDSLDIVSKDDDWIVYFNDTAKDRINLVLWYMHDQQKIDDATYNAAKADNIRKYINPGTSATTYSKYSYFVDYIKDSVLADLQDYMGYSADEASKLLYTGGLTIHSTLDPQIQDIVEKVYSDPENFPDVGTLRKDKAGNILYMEGDRILLYSKENMFNENDEFVLKKDEFKWTDDGDLQIFKGGRLNIYNTTVGGNTDYSIEFKSFYEIEDKQFYSINGGAWSIPAKYKTRNENGDVIIDSSFFKEKPDVLTRNDNGTVTLSADSYSLAQRVLQPQSAMTIIDYTTSQLVAMIGGRGIEGKLLFNRATSTRQPGSSIKPLSVYSTALQAGVDGLGNFYAAMPLDDRPIKQNNNLWPKNWYTGYTGITNLRHAVEQSINTCAVQLYLQLDPQMCIDNLEGMGISSLVTSGTVNDVNASALSLGGMTKGISPLEMTGAYATFGNYGVYSEPICYTKVTNKRGDVIIDKEPKTHKVMDESVASLMTDILRTTVTNGLASAAKMKSSETAGKTGTTSEKYDIWFCGLTPKYSASVWIGNDVNISLKQGSTSAVNVWKLVMDEVCALDEDYKKFEMRGEFTTLTVDKVSGKLMGALSSGGVTDLFIAGTEPSEIDDSHVLVNVCAETGYLATPYCTSVITKVGTVRPGGTSWEKLIAEYGLAGKVKVTTLPDARYDAPEFYCPLHNPSTSQYPVSPLGMSEAFYNPNDYVPDVPEEPVDEDPENPEGNPEDPSADPGVIDPGAEPQPGDVTDPIQPPADDPNPAEPGAEPQPGTDVPPVDPENPGPAGPENPPAPDGPPAQDPEAPYTPAPEDPASPAEPGQSTETYVDANGEIIYNW